MAIDVSKYSRYIIPGSQTGGQYTVNNYYNNTTVSSSTAQTIFGFVKESSLGTSFSWIGGLLEASGSGGDRFYVDGSLNNIRATYVRSASLGTGITFNSTTGKWDVSASGSGGATSLIQLTDVSIVGIANNDYIKYNASTSKYKNVVAEDAGNYFYTKYQIDASFNSVKSPDGSIWYLRITNGGVLSASTNR
jgi:hypothetical protein